MTYLAFDDIKLERTTQVRTTSRIQRAQFGDGYSQVLSDGLNQNIERWQCTTGLLTEAEAYSVESYLLSLNGTAITWQSPLDTKTFSRPFAAGEIDVGYRNLSSLSLPDYTLTTDYTVNLGTGIVTSVTISNSTVVEITLTLSARTFLLDQGIELTPETPGYAKLKFGLTQVYL